MADVRLSDDIVEIIEGHDFWMNDICQQGNEYYVEIGKGTPAGEDWMVCVWFDGTDAGFIEGVRKAYEGFDVDEEVEIWVDNRGKNGVPSSIRTLVEDAEWKEAELLKLAEKLEIL